MNLLCAWCDGTIKEFGRERGFFYGICSNCRKKHFPETLRTVRENGKAILAECLLAAGRVSIAVLFFAILFGLPCFAADTSILPDKPEARYAAGKVHTADREYWIEAGAFATAWTLDGISTHNADPRAREAGIFFPGTRSTAKIMGAWAAVDIGAAVVSYEWKKHVRNRFLHPLWRVPMLAGTFGHDYSAIGNFSLGKGIGPSPAVAVPSTSFVADPSRSQPLRIRPGNTVTP
jgi:hypothetical protein